MKTTLTTLAVLLIAAAACGIARAQIEGSHAFTFAENDNHLIILQARGGDPAKPGSVKIEFYGHMAFKVTSPEGVSVLVDPWRNDQAVPGESGSRRSSPRFQSTSSSPHTPFRSRRGSPAPRPYGL